MEENKRMKKFDNKSLLLYNAYMDNLMKKLEIYRFENRISQRKLAKLLNVHFSTVNRWFNNRTTPNKIQRYHIKKLLDTHKLKLKDKHFEIT